MQVWQMVSSAKTLKIYLPLVTKVTNKLIIVVFDQTLILRHVIISDQTSLV